MTSVPSPLPYPCNTSEMPDPELFRRITRLDMVEPDDLFVGTEHLLDDEPVEGMSPWSVDDGEDDPSRYLREAAHYPLCDLPHYTVSRIADELTEMPNTVPPLDVWREARRLATQCAFVLYGESPKSLHAPRPAERKWCSWLWVADTPLGERIFAQLTEGLDA